MRATDPEGALGHGATRAAFVGAVLIGGTNVVAVRFSNESLDPLFGAALRFGCASLLFILIATARRVPFPRDRALAGAVVYGLLATGVTYALLYYALVGLRAGTMSVVLAASPLVTLVVAVVARQERFTARTVAGGVLAVVGIGILSAGSLGGDLSPSYLIAAILATVSVALSTVVVKGFPKAHPLTTNAVGMSAGTVLLAVASLFFDERWALPSESRTWIVLAWLIVPGSVGLFQLFLLVVKRWTASATVYGAAIMPVVTVTLAALIADEPITAEILAGVALVMLAVYVGARQPRKAAEDAG